MNFSKQAKAIGSLGYFERPGEYMKDFFFLKDGATYHLIYNRGEAGPVQRWDVPGNEDSFGHATSTDLVNWEFHDPVMYADQGNWEEMVISAPCIKKIGGVWTMFYTGFAAEPKGYQAIGMAESDDLVHWRKDPDNPIYKGPGWARVRTEKGHEGYFDCRDPHVIEYDGHYIMYTSVLTNWNEGAIAIAKTKDFRNWTDCGWAFTEPKTNDLGFGRVPESPVVFERDGTWFMLTSQNRGYLTKTPDKPIWEPFDFAWPSQGFWVAFEVVEEGDRTLGAAFEWKTNGNHIAIWEFEWKDGKPCIDYGLIA